MIKSNTVSQKILFDELSKYSDWPAKLLSLIPTSVKYKTEAEVLREYQDEEWGNLLEKIKVSELLKLIDIENIYCQLDQKIAFVENDEFFLGSYRNILDKHLELYAKILEPYLENCSALVELGAGFGSKLFGLSQNAIFSGIPLFAGEFTSTGRELISLIATLINKPVVVGHCDFRKLIFEIDIPENSVIFTSYSAHYVPQLSNNFVKALFKFKPKVVVLFEPCYELQGSNSIHELMCKRYIELNDYTQNLSEVVESGCLSESISYRIQKNVLGSNPFLPISIFELTASDNN